MKRAALFVFAFLLSSFNLTFAAPPSPLARAGVLKQAEIISVHGEGWVRFVQQNDWGPAARMQALTSGDALKTGDLGKMDLLFADGSQIKVHHRTTIHIRETASPGSGRGGLLGLDIGEVWSRTKSSPEGLRIKTPSATASIRGTDWDILVDEAGTCRLLVLRGEVELANEFGSVSVGAGQQGIAEVGKAPVKVFLVRPKDRVQWIISYPMEIADIVTFRTHRRGEAMKAAAAARKTSDTASDKLILAELLFDAGDRRGSSEILREAAAEPANGRALLLGGYLELSEGQMEGALVSFRRAEGLVSRQDLALVLLGLAGVHLQRGEIAEAGAMMEGAASESVGPEAGVAFARFRAFQGDFTGAVGICRSYAERFPGDERFPLMIADFSITLDDTVQAEGAIKAARAISPDSSEVNAVQARLEYLQGHADDAEKFYRSALAADPGNVSALSEYGKLLMEKGHFEDSYARLSEAVDRAPRVSLYTARRGMLMNWLEDIPAARSDLMRATELNPGDYQSLTGLGVIALKEGSTGDAVQNFLKAGLLEPDYAEPHVFLSVAYYQLGEIERALEELKVAETLDPKDPVPHIIAHIIYQDTYRPMLAVGEATAALKLLPNLKSVNPAQDTKRGLSNLGSALLGLGMDEWAGSYAEESFDLFDSASYRFVANRFADNPAIYLSANMQSFLLNPMSIGFDNRYQDIVLRPQHNFTVRTRLGFEEGHAARQLSLIQEGYFRKPFEIDYLLEIDGYQNDGYRDNGYSRGYFITYALGGRPDYKNGFFIYGGATKDKLGDPGPVTRPDPDDYDKKRTYQVTAGYNRRLGPKQNLFIAFQRSEALNRYINPDPLGVTVPDSLTASFIKWFGLDGARRVYDYNGVPFHDPSGSLAAPPFLLTPITAGLPLNLDENSRSLQRASLQSTSVHVKHIAEIRDVHQVSVGVERTRHTLQVSETDTLQADYQNGIPYVDVPTDSIKAIPTYMSGSFPWTDVSQSGTTTIAYINDRWKISDSFLVEAGLFQEIYRDEINDVRRLHPRIGVSWKFHKYHILRTAFQQRLLPVDPTLSPFAVAGVGFTYPRSQAFPGDRITDYQAGIESKWTERLYSEIRYERRYHRWQKTRTLFPDMTYFDREDVNNRADLVSAALNLIITDRVGAFARYTNTSNRNISGRAVLRPLETEFSIAGKKAQYEPEHLFSAGLVYVSPRYLKAVLATRYVSSQFVDDDNSYRLPNYWSADMKVTAEFFMKHLQLVFDLRNIFDTSRETDPHIPGPGRSYFVALEYRF